ncbi:hypothetical protein AAVH_01466 [Aphelenchoides avenae]|nr:hypothetical protein AAVH_01466 [Aphelenchus avenae]
MTSYIPVPYRAPPNFYPQQIPSNLLNQIVQQHMAHTRLRQQSAFTLAENEPILTGVSRITELRQTPFRYFPSNSSTLSYAEKRRRWKAEMTRRLKGKVPTRPISPLYVQDEAGIEGRYFVSKRPPPYLYTTKEDRQLSPLIPLTATAISVEEKFVPETPRATPSYEIEDEDTTSYETTTETSPTSTTTSTTTTTTTTVPPPPPIITIRKSAQEVPSNQTYNLQVRVAPLKPSLPPVRQVLRLDYYDDDQQMEDDVEEEEEEEEANVIDIHPPTVASIPWGQIRPPTTTTTTTQVPPRYVWTTPPIIPTTAASAPRRDDGAYSAIVYPTPTADRRGYVPTTPPMTRPPHVTRRMFIQELGSVALTRLALVTARAPVADEYAPDDYEEDSEELFFWKPDFESRKSLDKVDVKDAAVSTEDPFRIEVHEANRV